MVGSTIPAEAEPGTVRGDYSLDTTCNSIHASDSPENAEREMRIFFRKGDTLIREANRERVSLHGILELLGRDQETFLVSGSHDKALANPRKRLVLSNYGTSRTETRPTTTHDRTELNSDF